MPADGLWTWGQALWVCRWPGNRIPLTKREAGKRAAGQVAGGALAGGAFGARSMLPRGKPAQPGIRLQWAFAGQSRNKREGGGFLVHGCCLLVSRSLTAHFLCIRRFPEQWFDDSCLGPNCMETF